MWAKVESGSVVEIITSMKSVTSGSGVDLIQYPKNIFKLWSQSDLADIGFYKYLEAGKSDRSDLYINGDPDYTIDGTVVTGTYTPSAIDTLDNLKSKLINSVKVNVRNNFRSHVDDHYAEKYRTGSYTIPDAVEVYTDALTVNFTNYKKAVNEVDNISDLKDISMLWPDTN